MLQEIFNISTNTRIHWIYLVSAALLSLFFIKKTQLLSFHYIWNKSSAVDLKLFITNRVLKYFIILPFEGASIFFICKWWLSMNTTQLINIPLGSITSIVIYTTSLFIFDDFLRFFQHYLMHKVPALWEVHKVHHSAHSLNPLTLYRAHPVEVFIAALRRIFGTSVITCVTLSISSQSISAYQIMGALSINFIFNLIGGNLRHSHIPLSFGVFERIFISPLQHQIHHSKNPEHFDKNFGVALSIWDQLFKSWYKPLKGQQIRVGLVYSERNHQSTLLSTLTSPLIQAFNKLSLPYKKGVSLTNIKPQQISNYSKGNI